jgi:hypothetical protein
MFRIVTRTALCVVLALIALTTTAFEANQSHAAPAAR